MGRTGWFNRLDPYAGNHHDPQSLHKYGYSHGDPVNGVDPSGAFTLLELIIVVLIVSIVLLVGVPAIIHALREARRNGLVARANAQLLQAGRHIHSIKSVDPVGKDTLINGYMHAFAMARAAANPGGRWVWSDAEEAYWAFQWRERPVPGDSALSLLQKRMDRLNNETGYHIGVSLATAKEGDVTEKEIMEALNEADLYYIQGETNLVTGKYYIDPQ